MIYAIVESGIVVNIIMGLPVGLQAVNITDRPVAIGDTYSNGSFYRDGQPVLTDAEYIAQLEAAIEQIEGAVNE